MQEMHGKQWEGWFLGVKLDDYSAPGARQDRRDVNMDQDTATGDGRPDKPGSKSASHKDRQVTVAHLCKDSLAALRQPAQRCNPAHGTHWHFAIMGLADFRGQLQSSGQQQSATCTLQQLHSAAQILKQEIVCICETAMLKKPLSNPPSPLPFPLCLLLIGTHIHALLTKCPFVFTRVSNGICEL